MNLGLVDQQYLVRSPRPEAKSKQTVSRQRTERDRESDRWLDSSRRIGPAPAGPDTRWVRIADRESDIYEYIIECIKRNHGFLVRVNQDRIILDPADKGRLGLVFDHIRGVEPLGGLYLDLRTRPAHDGHKGYKARRARLLVSCIAVRIQSPERPGHAAGTNEPVDCWCVRVWEPEPPEGVERLEWVLYTDQKTETLEEAIASVMDYGSRFLIEEFHKGTQDRPEDRGIAVGEGASHLRGDRGHERCGVAVVGHSRVGQSGARGAGDAHGVEYRWSWRF